MLELAKKGDRVWSISYGWGTILDIEHRNEKPVLVKFNCGKYKEYTLDGKEEIYSINPTIFWNEIKIEIPNKKFDLKSFLIRHIKPINVNTSSMGSRNYFYFSYSSGDYYDLYDYEWYVINTDCNSIDVGKFYFDIIKGKIGEIERTLTNELITYEEMNECLKKLNWI